MIEVETTGAQTVTERTQHEYKTVHEFYAKDESIVTTEQAKESFNVPDVGYNASRGVDLTNVETSAAILLKKKDEGVILSPRSAVEKKSPNRNWFAQTAKLAQASKEPVPSTVAVCPYPCPACLLVACH